MGKSKFSLSIDVHRVSYEGGVGNRSKSTKQQSFVHGSLCGLLSSSFTQNVNRNGVGALKRVSELYVRNDIQCPVMKASGKCHILTSNSKWFVIPTASALDDYCDLIEQMMGTPLMENFIILGSILSQLRMRGFQRTLARTIEFLQDPRKKGIFFSNQHFKGTMATLSPVKHFLKWVRLHIEKTSHSDPFEVVVLTNNPVFLDDLRNDGFKAMTPYDLVCSSNEYAHTCDASLIYQLKKVADSIRDRLNSDSKAYESTSPRDHVLLQPYWDRSQIEIELKKGKVVKGCLEVSENCFEEARVGNVLINGRDARNRSIHGDIVVVRLLPESEWSVPPSKRKLFTDHVYENEGEGINNIPGSNNKGRVPTGTIVAVVERRWRQYVVSLSNEDTENFKAPESRSSHSNLKYSQYNNQRRDFIVETYDSRIPRIWILTNSVTELLHQRFVVSIDEWPIESKYPRGHYVRTIGPIGDLTAESTVILIESGLENHLLEFTDAAMKCLPAYKNWQCPPTQIENRLDLRDQLIFSVDPAICQDIDDAMSFEVLEGTKSNPDLVRAGVHIADVTYFLTPNSQLDKEAAKRATSVYLEDRRLDMLPRILCEDLCSLRPGVDRLAVSVIWDIQFLYTADKQSTGDSINPCSFKIIKSWTGRTVIRSAHALSYNQAQRLYCGEDPGEEPTLFQNRSHTGKRIANNLHQTIRDALTGLVNLARLRRKQRAQAGALDLTESSEFTFATDATNKPNAIHLKDHLEVHDTIAELMIMANEHVAREISEKFPLYALLRRHPPPTREKFESVKEFAKLLDLNFVDVTNTAISSFMSNARERLTKEEYSLLNQVIIRGLSEAQYFVSGSVSNEKNHTHFGLGVDFYTHFTSPIRRYADVIVHRLLLQDVPMSTNTENGINKFGGERNLRIDLPTSLTPSTFDMDLSDQYRLTLLRAYGIQPEREESDVIRNTPRTETHNVDNTLFQDSPETVEMELNTENDELELDTLLTGDVPSGAKFWSEAVRGPGDSDEELDAILDSNNVTIDDSLGRDILDEETFDGDQELDFLLASDNDTKAQTNEGAEQEQEPSPNLRQTGALCSTAVNTVSVDDIRDWENDTSMKKLVLEAEHINEMHRNAKAASQKSTQLYLSLYFAEFPQALPANTKQLIIMSEGEPVSAGIAEVTHSDSNNLQSVTLSAEGFPTHTFQLLDEIFVWISCDQFQSSHDLSKIPTPRLFLISSIPGSSTVRGGIQSRKDVVIKVTQVDKNKGKHRSPASEEKVPETKTPNSIYHNLFGVPRPVWKSDIVANRALKEFNKRRSRTSTQPTNKRFEKGPGRIVFGYSVAVKSVSSESSAVIPFDGSENRLLEDRLNEDMVKKLTLGATRRTERLLADKRDAKIKRFRKRQGQ